MKNVAISSWAMFVARAASHVITGMADQGDPEPTSAQLRMAGCVSRRKALMAPSAHGRGRMDEGRRGSHGVKLAGGSIEHGGAPVAGICE